MLEKTFKSPLDCKEIKPVNLKGNQSWIFTGRTDAEAETPMATWCDELTTHWKRPWFWQRLKAGGDEDDRGWDGWTPSPTWWTWVWVGSGSWWWTRKPSVLQSMGLQRVRYDLATELDWTKTVKTVVDVLTDVMEGQFLEGLICHYKQLGFYRLKYEPLLSFG